MGGSNLADQRGRTGLRGRLPRATFLGRGTLRVTWTDAAGNLWLFGGFGCDSSGTCGQLGYTQRPVEVQCGPMDVDGRIERRNQEGTYGTQGTAAAGNVPGARA